MHDRKVSGACRITGGLTQSKAVQAPPSRWSAKTGSRVDVVLSIMGLGWTFVLLVRQMVCWEWAVGRSARMAIVDCVLWHKDI